MGNGHLGTVLGQLRRQALLCQNTALTDAQLLKRFAAGREEAAFTALVQRHGPMVLNVCRQVLGDVHDAEDAFQATFLILVRKAGGLRQPELLGSWLFGVAHRVAVRARVLLHRQRRREHQGVVFPAAQYTQDAVLHEWGPLLHEEVSRLPVKYRAPVVLCYYEGKTNTEAALQLHWPIGTVKGRLTRARDLLRKRLRRRGLALCASMLIAQLADGTASAAVPAGLTQATIQAALEFAAGSAATGGVIAAPVAALTKGVLQAMWMTKLKVAAVCVLAVGVFGLAAGLLIHAKLAAQPSVARSALAVLPVEAPEERPATPEGWFAVGSNPDDYEMVTDRKVAHGGKASARMKAKADEPKGFGTLMQSFEANDYRGKRLRLSAYVKTDQVEDQAALWVRIDSKDKTVGFDNMNGRPIKGTTEWTRFDIVLDVPEKSVSINFGLLLAGKGQAWVDDFRFEVVGQDVKTTNLLEQEIDIEAQDRTFPNKPVNLDFEK
jgi:RNA polymerase sigma factor (sigma-70 family)